jgi:hypothetical protein
MSQEHGWTMELMARSIHEDRLAEAQRYHMAKSVVNSSTSPRIYVANALRSLASLLDGGVQARTQPDRQFARA